MKPQTKALREAVKHIPEAWVRVWREGVIWAGSHQETMPATLEVKSALEAAGYHCEMNGKPGTEGIYIIDITVT